MKSQIRFETVLSLIKQKKGKDINVVQNCVFNYPQYIDDVRRHILTENKDVKPAAAYMRLWAQFCVDGALRY